MNFNNSVCLFELNNVMIFSQGPKKGWRKRLNESRLNEEPAAKKSRRTMVTEIDDGDSEGSSVYLGQFTLSVQCS